MAVTKLRTWTVIGTVAGALVAVGGVLSMFDIPVPRPAWSDELIVVEGKIAELDQMLTSDQLSNTTLRLYQNLREQEKYVQDRIPVPDFLLNEQTMLESRKRTLEKRLEDILDAVTQ